MNTVSPMKHKRSQVHSDSYKTSLQRSEQYKQLTNERQQHRKNKRLTQRLGA